MKVSLAPFDATIDVRDDAAVRVSRAAEAPPIADVTAALRTALDVPQGFPALKRALTPDDRIVIVVDDQLPSMGLMIGEILSYVGDAGIVPEGITLLSPAGSRQPWVDELPDAWQDVRTEIHDPTDRRRLSYLASTRNGRRIYLNRTLIDADQAIVLSGCRFDAHFGYMGGASSLFPALSDTETMQQIATTISLSPHESGQPLLEAETEEVAWLFGVPFFIQVIEGAGDSIAHIVGGTVESMAEGRQLFEARWRAKVERPAHTVVASLLGDPAHHDFATLAAAAVSAARAVEPGGRIVLLSQASPDIGDGMSMLRDTDSTAVAARRVQERNPPDRVAAQLWLEAATKADLYLLSRLPDELVEELFATPLQQARQVQRLVDAARSCLFLSDAHKMCVEVEPHAS